MAHIGGGTGVDETGGRTDIDEMMPYMKNNAKALLCVCKLP
jgi:hypothetical protein